MEIIVAGDFCPLYRVADLFNKEEYSSVLGEIREITHSANYSIVNFECPVAFKKEKPIEKCGPNLKCSKNGIAAIKWAGFNCVTLANNHILDYGKEGIVNTLAACSEYDLDSVGVGNNIQEASCILYKKIQGKTVAIINCCEHEFSIATNKSAGSNPLNPIQQYYSIKQAKSNSDYVLVIVHGGHEFYQYPSLRMQEAYRFFIDAGADAVVNHHQHCYSGFEIYNERPIFYGLGNFCFDYPQYSKKCEWWSYGYLVKLSLEDRISFKILPYEQCLESPKIRMLPVDNYANNIKEINSVICDKTRLESFQNEYYDSKMKETLSAFQPFRNIIFAAARRMNLFPSIMSRKWQVILENMILCESHKDKVEYFFHNYKRKSR